MFSSSQNSITRLGIYETIIRDSNSCVSAVNFFCNTDITVESRDFWEFVEHESFAKALGVRLFYYGLCCHTLEIWGWCCVHWYLSHVARHRLLRYRLLVRSSSLI